MRLALTYLATLLAIGVLDGIWLGVVAKDWYASGMGHLMAAKPNWIAAAVFYLGYPVGVLVFAGLPAGGDAVKALAVGALFGLFCYGTFDVTSWAVLRDYPGWLTALDIAWGSFVSAMGALVASQVTKALAA